MGPRVKSNAGRLTATTALWLQFLTLGCFYRKVVVIAEEKEVRWSRRYVWFFRRRARFGFGAIEAVTYGYEDLRAGQSYLSNHHASQDRFVVGLRLRDGSDFHLFSFLGGTLNIDGPWPEWLSWFKSVEQRSRAFAERLSELIGVPIVPPQRI